ncbi:sigma-70 family RNA polymerase sigma factor [Candidatus Peregrinibacteria bacterium]|nr:sigma-70 family RNA polymerase sigma factor [Candidatus Peregrinibacteria bacterium]MBI3816867.1 sigma-70 family RNA polymerase sigma factor [Candidatus Peregrinibacteria bacterium]
MQDFRVLEDELQALVRQAQEGDTEAFGKVYDHLFLPVYRYAAFRAPAEIVEDVVSDIFVKAWEKLHTYRAQKGIPFPAWLFRIARHTIIDAYRRQRHFEEVSDELVDSDAMNRADDAMRRDDTLRVVREAMAKLPRRSCEILLLSYIAELPTSEVARILRMSEGAVRIRKFRALKKLELLLPPDIREKA